MAPKHFVVITDPGSALEAEAKKLEFAHIFHGVKSIGGRYSVLSKFGLVPAAAIGLDVRACLESAQQMVRSCGDDVPPSENPGVKLGVALGVCAKQFKRDKVTVVASPAIAGLGAWLETAAGGKHRQAGPWANSRGGGEAGGAGAVWR